MRKTTLVLAALAPILWGCEDTTGPEGAERVAIRFQAVTPAGAVASRESPSAALSPTRPAASITLTGGGRTLVLDDIRLIVAEIELERLDGECSDGDDDACEEFEGGPFLVDLLDGRADEVVTASIPAGRYTELEFEVENLDPDEDDDAAERQAIQNVLREVRQAYPAFPADASMVVRGSYDGRPFTVYFDAEIEVEKEFGQPLQIPGAESILVSLDPAAWFVFGGVPYDLSALDGRTVEFELAIQSEFGGAFEVDDD